MKLKRKKRKRSELQPHTKVSIELTIIKKIDKAIEIIGNRSWR